MNRRKSLGTLAVAMLVVSTGPVAASSGETSTSYDATYEYDANSTAQKLDETMTIRRGEPQAFIELSSTGGASFDGPTKFANDGEIATVSSDPSVTCYNMAAASVYNALHAPGEPNYVYVHAGDGIVRIRLETSKETTRDGSLVLTGNGSQTLGVQSQAGTVPVRLDVASRIRVVGDTMMDVTFEQTTAVGSSGNVISRQACTLRPAENGPAPLT